MSLLSRLFTGGRPVRAELLPGEQERILKHPANWLLAPAFEHQLALRLAGLSAASRRREFMYHLGIMDHIPSARDVDEVRSSVIQYVSSHTPPTDVPAWVKHLPSQSLPGTVENPEALRAWMDTWSQWEQASRIIACRSELERLSAELNECTPVNDTPGKRHFAIQMQYVGEKVKRLQREFPSLPCRDILLDDFVEQVKRVDMDVRAFEEVTQEWRRLFDEAHAFMQNDLPAEYPDVEGCAVRLKHFVEKPADSPFNYEDLRRDIAGLREAVAVFLREEEEAARTVHDPYFKDPFPGGEPVWGDLATEIEDKTENRSIALQEILERWDRLVGRKYHQYIALNMDLNQIVCRTEEDRRFLLMIQPNSTSSLNDIVRWLKKCSNRPAGYEAFQRIRKRDIRAATELSRVYGDPYGILSNPVIQTHAWCRGEDETIALPDRLPGWVDDLLERWSKNRSHEIAERKEGWDRGFFTHLCRICRRAGKKKHILNMLKQRWSKIEQEDRIHAWEHCSEAIRSGWLEIWAKTWFAEEMEDSEIQDSLAVYTSDEKLKLLHQAFMRKPRPLLNVIETLIQHSHADLRNKLHTLIIKGITEETRSTRAASIIRVAAACFPADLHISGASRSFLTALLKEWAKPTETLEIAPRIIAEACESLAGQQFVFDELYLLFDERIPSTRRIRLTNSQWATLASAFEAATAFDIERVTEYLYQSASNIIPDTAWVYFVSTVRKNGESWLMNLPAHHCETVLENAVNRLCEGENGRTARLLWWFFKLRTDRCAAEDVPDHILEINLAS